MIARHAAAALALAAFLSPVSAPAAQGPAYVNVARAVAAHPLHAMLAQYDREIAALRATLTVPRKAIPPQRRAPAPRVWRAAPARRSRTCAPLPRARGTDDRTTERDALAAAGSSQRAADRAMAAYSAELARETSASLAAYGDSIAERNARALAARRQQLHERELTLAFDLARSNAGHRLALRLKLDDLRLDRSDRARVAAELAAMNARETRAVAAMRRDDAAVLAAYESRLRSDGATEYARMAAQLKAKAAANLATRRRVLRAGANAPAAQQLTHQAAAFSASYRPSADAQAVANGLHAASADISRRFAVLGATASASQHETVAQISTLQANRDALYRAMVRQVMREALAAAKARNLAGVAATPARPRGSVDVTPAVEAALRSF